MEAGQRVAIWVHDEAVKLFLGLTGPRPRSRWAVIGKVTDLPEVPIGVWVDIEQIFERRPKGKTVKKVSWTVKPSRCVIRWDYVITVQLLNEADKPEEIDYRPGNYL